MNGPQRNLTAIESLRDLPAKTLARRVGCILQSNSNNDKLIADVIVDVAYGEQRKWELREVRKLIADLEGNETRLDRWLTMQEART